MKVHSPQISVIITKSRSRSELANGIPVAGDRHAQTQYIDITDFLGDGSIVSVVKSVRSPCSGFTIRFADQPHQLMASIGDMLEPMDLIEIRVGDPTEVVNGKLPILLRGFVGGISRSETIEGGRPMRWITLNGHCLQKSMQIFRICYLPFSKTNQYAFSDKFKFFFAYAPSGNIKFMSGSDFCDLTVQHILNPFLEGFKGLAKLECTNIGAANEFTSQSSIEGSISPYVLSNYTDVSLHQLMSDVLDVGTLNEMYLEQTDGANTLVVRPFPARNIYGDFIQGHADSVDLASNEIISQTSNRSDIDVANWFWCTSARAALASDMTLYQRAAEGDISTFVKFDHFNASADVFGVRKLQVEINLMGPDMLTGDNPKEAELNEQAESITQWIEKKRILLAAINEDNATWESGTIRIRGQSSLKLKPGAYINVHRGVNQELAMSGYAHTVNYEYQFGNGFFCNISYDRGTGFHVRSSTMYAPYLKSIEAQGIK